MSKYEAEFRSVIHKFYADHLGGYVALLKSVWPEAT
jgi:hypothetical protein